RPKKVLVGISAFTAKKGQTLGTAQSPFSPSPSLERRELSNMLFLGYSQPCNMTLGTVLPSVQRHFEMAVHIGILLGENFAQIHQNLSHECLREINLATRKSSID
ncbi:hypothetical protein, partial [Mesotoga sp. HF07.pep.5.2.highcov]|uniref:hypothetical protein n=1 Tax=Mesotoga sp. HF07.pep.5.2.highcov TaxID=1462923 RepID=UPI001C7D0CC3